MSLIHSTAIVSPRASLDSSVRVGPYSIIEEGVEIGADSEIGSHCVIKGETTIGERNRIFQFASIGDDPQDKKYADEDTRLVIGNGNTIREYTTFNRGTVQDSGVTTIGDNNWFMAYTHVAHDCVVGNETIFANCAQIGGHVIIDDYAILGAFVCSHQYCRVGAHAFVGIGTTITRDIPPYVMASGPVAEPRGINTEGLKRRSFDNDQIRNIKEAYRCLYRSGLGLDKVRTTIDSLVDEQPELAVFAEFLNSSERGLIR
ncbi:MAG: acyl-ACP--UDP-N-acetylglucosamine O-acyltransferase [Gammaproteobacteria bacterium]|jgi:UDP-N-acetylglucosamine acyltransferase|nr:acyl-ACP--UDP-N-acetylglucosamine O-acyltransferase [Gammaproteobacteria bacterium]MDP6615803.1 acyl-ACP--UDP-N-acetylglucosamine O-acyltransferase [Gammaproteobacteria bacterium]MDP6695509.1 acyl-ACP--UDP-N-acetylglucosamine O-acyltransferase [Gammaproteobacteria bacterium]